MKNIFLRILYWIAELTYGGLMTLPGLLVAIFCILFLHGKPHKNGCSFIIEVGSNWGGISLGAVALCGGYFSKDSECYDLDWYDHTRMHEFGHSIQNIVFGPLFVFIVGIPSAIRCWYHSYRDKKGLLNPDYDAIWFEKTATVWGTNLINHVC